MKNKPSWRNGSRVCLRSTCLRDVGVRVSQGVPEGCLQQKLSITINKTASCFLVSKRSRFPNLTVLKEKESSDCNKN